MPSKFDVGPRKIWAMMLCAPSLQIIWYAQSMFRLHVHLLDSLNTESALTTHEGTIGSKLYSTKFQGKLYTYADFLSIFKCCQVSLH